jgi:nicotinamide-nucleotide amidase
MFSEILTQKAIKLLDQCRAQSLKIVTAESCTGGLLSALLTEIPGSSSVYERGFITYSNEAKNELLGVDPHALEMYGAVSEPVARAMVSGAIARSKATLAASVTGIAGPGGGSAEKPVGLVYIGVGSNHSIDVQQFIFSGNRHEIRLQSLDAALEMLLKASRAFSSVV